MDIQENSREDNAKFNFLGLNWESKRSWKAHFQAFREPKIQNFGNHVAISDIYWVHYKLPVLSYSEVGTYVYVISKRWSSKISNLNSGTLSVFFCIWEKDGKVFAKNIATFWHTAYRWINFFFSTSSVSLNSHSKFSTSKDKIQNSKL